MFYGREGCRGLIDWPIETGRTTPSSLYVMYDGQGTQTNFIVLFVHFVKRRIDPLRAVPNPRSLVAAGGRCLIATLSVDIPMYVCMMGSACMLFPGSVDRVGSGRESQCRCNLTPAVGMLFLEPEIS